MALFLITSLIDEGMYENDYRVVEAESREEVAQHMIDHSKQWENYLRSAYPRNWQGPSINYGTLLACAERPDMTAQRFLELVDLTHVDGDSAAQLRIFEIQVEQLSEIETNPFREWKKEA